MKVNVSGQTAFHNFPKCSRPENLQLHLGEWQNARLKFGQGIPDEHLKCMLMNTIPDSVAADIRKRVDIVTFQQVVNFIMTEVATYNDERLAKLQASKMSKLMNSTTKTPVNQVIADRNELPNQPEVPDIESVVGKVIAAMQAKGPVRRQRSSSPATTSRRALPDPKFDGCWECGVKGHRRQECKKVA